MAGSESISASMMTFKVCVVRISEDSMVFFLFYGGNIALALIRAKGIITRRRW